MQAKFKNGTKNERLLKEYHLFLTMSTHLLSVPQKNVKKLKNYKEAHAYLEKLLSIEPDAIQARALKKLLEQKYL